MAQEPVASDQSKAAPLGGSVIPIVNKLQEIFAQLGGQSIIELPQVAVVGSQSSGKSSVLEHMVGRDFLPRGADICTRRPLVLQLEQSKKKTNGPDDEFGEFLHLRGKKFYDFNAIRREIENETNREAGGNKGVSDKPILLKITSPNVLDITLVDLPGITKVPVGDQPSDIETQIRTMIMNYIVKENCLIIAVTPANADLTNSDALQMAKKADPDGTRTIGVITKLDIMDRGTDARKFLLGKEVPLRLGYVGVVNRCQEDIMLNRSIKDALVAEEKFFRSRPVYSDLADRCGIPQLAKKLNQVLVQHIKTLLPGLKARISAALVSAKKDHASYGKTIESKGGQGSLLLNILSKYSEALSSMIEGKNDDLSTTELSGGARIHYIFQSIFVKSLEEVDPCENLTDDDIRTALQNATGTKFSLFVPEVPFEVLVRKQIARLLDPSLQCARFIFEELKKMSHQCMVNELQRFPVLRKRMDEVVLDFLHEGLEPSKNMITNIIDMEMDYINTSHSNFIGGSKANEIALQHFKANRVVTPPPRLTDANDQERTQPSERPRSLFSRALNGVTADRGVSHGVDAERLSSSGLSEAIHAVRVGSSNNHASARQNSTSRIDNGHLHSPEHDFNKIFLREPPTILRPSDVNSEQVTLAISVTKLLLRSYYDIVRKNIEDSVPKAIMHFLVNHTKRELHNVFIRKLYRENLFEEMLREPDEMAMKRERAQATLRVLEQASRALDDLPLEADGDSTVYDSGADPTGLPKSQGLPSSSWYMISNGGSTEAYTASPARNHNKYRNNSGEL